MRLTNNGLNSLTNGLSNAFKYLGKAQLNQAKAENDRLAKGASVQRALAGVDNLNARTAIAQQKYDATQAILDALRGQGLDDRGVRNEMITAVNGKAYMPNAAIGNTGAVLDRATGALSVDQGNPVTQAFLGVQDALIRQRRSAAEVNAARQALLADRRERPERYIAGTYRQNGTAWKPSAATMRFIGEEDVLKPDGTPEKDFNGKPIKRFNPEKLASVLRRLDQKGLPRNDENLWAEFLGLTENAGTPAALPVPPASTAAQAVAAAVPAPEAPVAQANPRASTIQQVRERIRRGEITAEQGMAFLAEQGITD
jgi:hypothetical protein